MPAGVRLLPNAVTVVALCSGLSAVYYALAGHFELSVAAGAVAALCDALDGRLARLLDASSRIGAELDSLSDLVSFGVAPALVLYIWALQGTRLGWVVALIFAVCMALRLARFNTLLDADDLPPYAKEFFVGVPAPAAALVSGLPLFATLTFGLGWWSEPGPVGVWAVIVAGLMVSRLPTLSFKTVRVPPRLIAPLLVLVGLAAAGLMVSRLPTLSFKTVRVPPRLIAPLLVLVGLAAAVLMIAPFLGLGIVALGYIGMLPYALYRHRWLGRHPEAWNVPVRERRAVARAARSARRLGLRPPLRRRVAGRASAVARAVRRFGDEAGAGRAGAGRATNGAAGPGPAAQPSRNRLRLGLRRARRR